MAQAAADWDAQGAQGVRLCGLLLIIGERKAEAGAGVADVILQQIYGLRVRDLALEQVHQNAVVYPVEEFGDVEFEIIPLPRFVDPGIGHPAGHPVHGCKLPLAGDACVGVLNESLVEPWIDLVIKGPLDDLVGQVNIDHLSRFRNVNVEAVVFDLWDDAFPKIGADLQEVALEVPLKQEGAPLFTLAGCHIVLRLKQRGEGRDLLIYILNHGSGRRGGSGSISESRLARSVGGEPTNLPPLFSFSALLEHGGSILCLLESATMWPSVPEPVSAGRLALWIEAERRGGRCWCSCSSASCCCRCCRKHQRWWCSYNCHRRWPCACIDLPDDRSPGPAFYFPPRPFSRPPMIWPISLSMAIHLS